MAKRNGAGEGGGGGGADSPQAESKPSPEVRDVLNSQEERRS